jgi:hypothetical protein
MVSVLMTVLQPSPARAAAGTPCVFRFDVSLSPGMSLTPVKGAYSTAATGTLTCSGTIMGQHPTGAGSLTVSGTFGASSASGDTCLAMAGTGTYWSTIPTAEGSVSVSDDYTFSWGLGSSTATAPGTGRFAGQSSSGTFALVPLDGTCLSSPVTKAHIVGAGTFPS